MSAVNLVFRDLLSLDDLSRCKNLILAEEPKATFNQFKITLEGWDLGCDKDLASLENKAVIIIDSYADTIGPDQTAKIKKLVKKCKDVCIFHLIKKDVVDQVALKAKVTQKWMEIMGKAPCLFYLEPDQKRLAANRSPILRAFFILNAPEGPSLWNRLLVPLIVSLALGVFCYFLKHFSNSALTRNHNA